jgi:hypothetical protein
MTYSWTILKFETRDQVNSEGVTLSNAVVTVKWKRDGVDADGNTASVLGYTVLSAENVAQADFVAFDSLTEETVVGWLDSAEADSLSEYNTHIQAKINKLSSTERTPPWSS